MTGPARARLRDLGITIGRYPIGPHNAITDVPGVKVGHTTLIYDQPRIARTGVTAIIPRDDIGRDHCFAGFHSFNGNGEMTGMHWINESGLLSTPIAITATHYVGVAHRALVEYGVLILLSPRESPWLCSAAPHRLDQGAIPAWAFPPRPS